MRLPLIAALFFAVWQIMPIAAMADTGPCSRDSFEGVAYTICEAPLSKYVVKLRWQRPDGQAYTYLSALPKTEEKTGKLAFALNGGMFDPNYKPVGLYIEEGKELVAANTRNGAGNFHLKPNGVFYVSDTEADVMETAAFLKRRPKAQYATQSGPMLLVNGQNNPRISRARNSRKLRDGVCVRNRTNVIFAISEEGVAFDSFIRLFRQKLKCQNALFLDGGSAPALYLPSGERGGNTFLGLGPMIAVYERG